MELDGVKIDYLGHSGFLFSCIINGNERRIAIDPFNISDNLGKADVILITHSHYDHCSIKDIEKLSRKGTIIVLPADAQSKITRIEGVEMQVIELGDILEIGNIRVEAVPAYNLNKEFHPKKSRWFGYIIKIKQIAIYHAGDTDKISEMEKLTGYGRHDTTFVALLPISGNYVMSADEAAEAAGLIKPNLAIPMHYGSIAGTIEDAKRFAELCKEKGIPAQILEKI